VVMRMAGTGCTPYGLRHVVVMRMAGTGCPPC
jgi:hypothetical protein